MMTNHPAATANFKDLRAKLQTLFLLILVLGPFCPIDDPTPSFVDLIFQGYLEAEIGVHIHAKVSETKAKITRSSLLYLKCVLVD